MPMKKKYFSALLLITSLAVSLVPAVASAQLDRDIRDQLDPIAEVYGQNPNDVDFAASVAQIINVALGFIGIIFIVLIIYAGFVWMTSGGNEDKISTAKKTIIAAVIGVVIIIVSYAFTNFVLVNLLRATAGGRY